MTEPHEMGIVYLRKEREKIQYTDHQWVFSGSIEKVENVKEGNLVLLLNSKGETCGWGVYDGGDIAVRIIAWEKPPENLSSFFTEKIKNAFEKRKKLGFPSPVTNGYRLFFGESDYIPSLIIDVYDELAVIQIQSKGIYSLRHYFIEALENLKIARYIFFRYDPLFLSTTSGYSQKKIKGTFCTSARTDYQIFFENTFPFFCDFMYGQKTGFFLDQRNNREFSLRFVKDKRVLDLFSYTGGFTIYALRGGASHVVAVDVSQRALDLLKENAKINQVRNYTTIQGEVKYFLKTCNEKFDVIIVDPPAFAKHISHVRKAYRAYLNVNMRALKLLNKGGVMFTFSCSQAISKELFIKMLMEAGRKAGRRISIIKFLHQPEDHPVNLFHQETNYLKGASIIVD